MELSERQKRWFWLMDYCKNNQLSPANRESWEKAEEAWELDQKQKLKDEKVKYLRKGMKIKFKGDIGYSQDFSHWHGEFKDVVFTFIEKTPNGLMVFEAPGYGLPGDYGNGRIYVTEHYRDSIMKA